MPKGVLSTMSVEEIYENLKQPEEVYDNPDVDELLSNMPPKVTRASKPTGMRPTPNRPPATATKPAPSNRPGFQMKKEFPFPKSTVADKKTPIMMRNNFGQGFPKFGSQSFGTHKNDNNNNNNKNNKMVQKPVPLLPNDRNSASNKAHVSYDKSYEIPANHESMYIVPQDNDEPNVDTKISHGPTRSLPPPPSHQDPPISASHFLHRIHTLKNNFEKQSSQPHFGQEETYEVCDSGPEALDPVQRSRNNSNSSQKSNASIRSNSSTPGTSRENSFRNNSNKHTKLPSPMENRPLPNPTDQQETYEIVDSSERPPMPLPCPSSGGRLEPAENYDYVEESVSCFPSPHKNRQGIAIPDDDEYEEPGFKSQQVRSNNNSYRHNINDMAPAIPVRTEDPKRLIFPLPKGQKPSMDGQKLNLSSPVDKLRMHKPRLSCDSGMDQSVRQNVHGGFQEKGRSESDTSIPPQRPVPPPPFGKKPQTNLSTNRRPLDQMSLPAESKPLLPPSVKPFHERQKMNPTPPINNRQLGEEPSPNIKPVQERLKATPPPLITPSVNNRPKPPVPSPGGRPLTPTQPATSYRRPPPTPTEDNSLSGCPWYHGKVNRQESEKILLERNKEGGFIVRETDKGSGYSISIFYVGTVTHLRIPLKNNLYFLGSSGQSFTSVKDLVTYYQAHKIQLTSGGEVKLKV